MKKLQIGKGRSRSFLFAAALTLTLLALAGCTDITNPPPFVPVTDITGVPATGTAGTEVDLSNAKVVPADASYQVITWTVADAGATGVTDTGIVKGKFTPTGAGRLVLTATVPNGKAEGDDFTRQFEITISAAAVAVTGIANVPSTAYVGYSLKPDLEATTIEPAAAAAGKTIVWTVKDPGATNISVQNNFTPESVGEMTLTATVAEGGADSQDFTKDFTINVIEKPVFVAVTDILGVPTVGTVGTELILTGTVSPSTATNKDIVWTVKDAGTTGVTTEDLADSTVTPGNAGTLVLTATIANGAAPDMDFVKDNITVIISENFVAVTDIEGVPSAGTVGVELILTGTVLPSAATNKDIVWTVKDAGTTGVTTEDLADGTVTPGNAGTLVLTATIANGAAPDMDFVKDNITVTIRQSESFVAVTGITNVPVQVWRNRKNLLSGVVQPANATEQGIVWSPVEGTLSGFAYDSKSQTYTTTPQPNGATTLTFRATVPQGKADGTDFTRDVTVSVVNFVEVNLNYGVNGISGVPTTGFLNQEVDFSSAAVNSVATHKTIVWELVRDGTTPAGVTAEDIATNRKFTATTAGDVKIKATVEGAKLENTGPNNTVELKTHTATFTIEIIDPAAGGLPGLKAEIAGAAPNTTDNPYAPDAVRLAALVTTDAELSDLLNYIKDGSGGANVYVSLDLSGCPIQAVTGVSGNNNGPDYLVHLTLPTAMTSLSSNFGNNHNLKTLVIAAPGLLSLPTGAFQVGTDPRWVLIQRIIL